MAARPSTEFMRRTLNGASFANTEELRKKQLNLRKTWFVVALGLLLVGLSGGVAIGYYYGFANIMTQLVWVKVAGFGSLGVGALSVPASYKAAEYKSKWWARFAFVFCLSALGGFVVSAYCGLAALSIITAPVSLTTAITAVVTFALGAIGYKVGRQRCYDMKLIEQDVPFVGESPRSSTDHFRTSSFFPLPGESPRSGFRPSSFSPPQGAAISADNVTLPPLTAWSEMDASNLKVRIITLEDGLKKLSSSLSGTVRAIVDNQILPGLNSYKTCEQLTANDLLEFNSTLRRWNSLLSSGVLARGSPFSSFSPGSQEEQVARMLREAMVGNATSPHESPRPSHSP